MATERTQIGPVVVSINGPEMGLGIVHTYFRGPFVYLWHEDYKEFAFMLRPAEALALMDWLQERRAMLEALRDAPSGREEE